MRPDEPPAFEPASFLLTVADIERELAPRDVGRGRAYANSGRVNVLEFTSHSPSEATARARVRGTRRTPYALSISMKRTRDGRLVIENSCDCPIGRDCKHVAATLFVLARRADVSTKMTAAKSLASKPKPQPNLQPPSAVTKSLDDPRVDDWLATIRETAPLEATAPLPGTERVAYLFIDGLKPSSLGAFPIRVVGTRLTKAGRWAFLRDISAESLAAAASRIVARDDATIGRLLGAYRSDYRHYSPLGEELVRRIIATGRAHYATLDSPPLALGPSRVARIDWITGDDGTQRPSLDFDGAPATALPGPTPWYVEPESGIAGPIDAALPAATLAALLAAPALSPTQAKRVRDEFERTMPAFALPRR